MRLLAIIGICTGLSLVWSPSWADLESEPNGTESNADELTPGTVITGQLSGDSDFDYYQIDVSNSDALNIDFASPNSSSTDNQWILAVQRPSDSIIVFQEILSPTAESPVNRVVEIAENGRYIIFVAPVGGSTPTPFLDYDLTVTPSNFQAPLSSFNGVWQDDIGAAVYSVHEGTDGILYIELPLDGSAWKAYLGGRTDNVATLNQIVGPGSSNLELTFITASTMEARSNGELLYVATFIYGD